MRIQLGVYVLLTIGSLFALVSHAFIRHEEFYPAIVHLSTNKISLGILYNFGFFLFIAIAKALLTFFIGHLRDVEMEPLIDQGRGFLLDMILFLVFASPTMDGKEVPSPTLLKYMCLIVAFKVYHLIATIRVSHMFEMGVPRTGVLVRVSFFLCFLLFTDCLLLAAFYQRTAASSTFYTWLLFETLSMTISSIIGLLKFGIHMIDLRLQNGWMGKSVYLFYMDLLSDVFSMVIFLVFMTVFVLQNPTRLPLYMTADVVAVARTLTQRIKSFRKYQQLTRNMAARFPDATHAELEAADTCIICRDALFEGDKKLPCSHVFHIECLKSWLVQQQSCPTCRADIPLEPIEQQRPSASASPDRSNDAATFSNNDPATTPQQQQPQSPPFVSPAGPSSERQSKESDSVAPRPSSTTNELHHQPRTANSNTAPSLSHHHQQSVAPCSNNTPPSAESASVSQNAQQQQSAGISTRAGGPSAIYAGGTASTTLDPEVEKRARACLPLAIQHSHQVCMFLQSKAHYFASQIARRSANNLMAEDTSIEDYGYLMYPPPPPLHPSFWQNLEPVAPASTAILHGGASHILEELVASETAATGLRHRNVG